LSGSIRSRKVQPRKKDIKLESKITILVIEDEEQIKEILKEFLSSICSKVLTASSYDDAVDICKSNSIDIVITDILLPGKDGFDIIRWMNNNSRIAGVPVIVITGVGKDIHSIELAKELFVDKYIFKPIDFPELKQAITEFGSIEYRREKLKKTIDYFTDLDNDVENKELEKLKSFRENIIKINQYHKEIQRNINSLTNNDEEKKNTLLEKVEYLKTEEKNLQEKNTEIKKIYDERHKKIRSVKRVIVKRMMSVK